MFSRNELVVILFTEGVSFSVQFGGSEAVITGFSDEYPFVKRNRELFVAGLFTLYFIVGLASCTQVRREPLPNPETFLN